MTIARIIRGIRDSIVGGDSSGRGIKLLGRRSQGEGPIEVLDLTELLRAAGVSGSADIQTLLDGITSTRGSLIERGAGGWVGFPPSAANKVLVDGGAGADPAWTALSALLDTVFGSARGDILYRGNTAWVVLAPGTSGHFLKTLGAGADPAWADNGANPSATAGAAAVNGSALTFMRSDGAPAVVKADASTFGLVKPDGTTISASGGVISAVQGGIITGYAIWGFHPLQYAADGISVANAMPANGGSLLCPIFVPAAMSLQGISYRNTDTTLARSSEWRLYLDSSNNSVSIAEVAGANGTDSFTAAAASTRDVACASPPVALLPGMYWLVLRNTHATNTLGIGAGAATNGLVPTYVKNKTLGSALSSPLDVDTSWLTSLFGNSIPAVRLNGRVLGKTALWS